MARLSPMKAGLALFVICLTLEHVTSSDKCRSGCNGVTPKHFKYAEGSTYKYNLESILDISLSSAEGQQSSTKLKATVLLTQQSQCNQIIRLQNVQVIHGADGKKHGSLPDVEKPIRINFHDGKIEDQICAEPGDTQNSLNIKRAIASLFQAAFDSNHETDIFGVCPTEIRSHKDGNVLIVTKTRSLNRCSHRENVKHNFLSTAFNLHSEIKSSPILKSDYVAEMKIKDGILDHVLVTENYLHMPFSVGKNGAKAVVQTKLHFVNKAKDSGKAKCTESKSIIFENPHPILSEKNDVSAISQAVKDTANTIGTSVGEHTAGKFAGLIKILTGSKKDDLLPVYNQIKSGAGFSDKVVAKKIFLDALFRAGTGDCIEVAIELLKNKELSPMEQKLVYLGMALIRHATPNSIASATTLLDQPNLPREAYLGVGTLAARYCGSHDCKNVEQVTKLSQKLLSKLKDGKPANRQAENEMISILKALTNMKHINDAAVPKIIAIAQDKKNPARLRVVALEAYKADACKDKFRDSAINILKDIQQDSEIRIKAYLALAECPNGKVAAAVKGVLDNEPSIQVGGFIVSHIRNLRASANPDKALAKRELANVNTMKRFPVDPRKYSFSSELSYAFDTLGVSSSIENNIIYSHESFVPRSVGFNLTTEIFGHKINFLEIDTRQENLDTILESLFGPQGELMKTDTKEFIETSAKDANKWGEHFNERLGKIRSKRQAPRAEIDSMGKQCQIKTHDLNKDMDLDLSVKLFGSEMLFLSLTEETGKVVPMGIIDKIFDTLDSEMQKAKNFDRTFRSNMLFADMELSYATSMGFPLRIGVEGTSAVQIKAAGSVDLAAIANNKDSVMKLSLIPSANVELSCKMTVDAGIAEKGLKTISNLYTSTGGAVVVEFTNSGKGFDMKFTLPIEKQQLLSAKHEIVFTNRDAGCADTYTPLKFIENKDFSICMDQLNPIIGLTACAELNTPNTQLNQGLTLPYPFNGNSKASVWIEREEPITYHVRNIVFPGPNSKVGFEFVTEMLGANNQPKVSFQVEGFVAPEKYIKATLDSPIKKMVLEGRLIDNNQEKSISGKFVHDTQIYSGKIGVSVKGTPAKSVYTPLIEYVTPQAQGAQKSPYTVEGTITAEVNNDDCKYTFNNVKLVAPQKHPIVITGNVGRTSGSYFSDIQLNDGTHSGTFKGDIKVAENMIKLNGDLKNTLSPYANFNIKYNFKKEKTSVKNDLVLALGTDQKSNVLSLYNFIENSEKKFSTKNKITYPAFGIEAKLEFVSSEKEIEYDVDLEYNKMKFGSDMDLKMNQKVDGDYDFEFELYGMENKLKLKSKRDILGDKSKIDNSLEINGKKTEVSGQVLHKIKENDVDVGAQLTIKCFVYPEPINVDHALSYNTNEIKTHMKVSSPSNVYLDCNLKASKSAGANGHLKVNLKDTLVANGEIKADKWIGKASLVLELLKLKNKMKVDSTFTLVAPNYNVALTYYPHFEKDDKKIYVNTNNVVKEGVIDSKNNIDVFGHKFEVNAKRLNSPKSEEAKVDEVEVTLPNDMYIIGKLNRNFHTSASGVLQGNGFFNLEQRKNKNTPGRKISVKADVKNYVSKTKTFDITYNVALDDSNGHSLNSDLNVVKNENDGFYNVDVNSKTYGSILPEVVEIRMNSKCNLKHDVGSSTINVKAGSKLSANINTKLDVSEGKIKPMVGELNFDIQTSNPKFKKMSGLIAANVLQNDKQSEFGGKLKLDTEDGTNPEGSINLFTESSFSFGEHNGKINSNLKFQKSHPINLALSYGHKEEGTTKTCFSDGSLTYAENKNIKYDYTLTRPNENEFKLDFKLNTPFEQAKTTTVNQHFKKSDDGKNFNTDVALTVDDKKYLIVNELVVSESAPMFKLEITNPNGKTDKIVAKATKGETHYSSDLVVVYNEKDFTFDGSVDAQIASIEDFIITVKLDSPKMKLDKLDLVAKNTKNKAAKVIEIQATSNNNNIIKGSTTYKTREEGGKYIAEGSGEFMVKDQKKTGNFKLIKRRLSVEKDGEQGVEINFDAGLGNKAVDAELKLTNKQFRIVNSYCEEKKQCAHFEIDSKTTTAEVNEYHHELEVNVDLRKLGLLHEFGLKSVTSRKQLVLDHTVDIHFQSQENNKYQYSLYLHPKEAGISLSTPKRTVAVEGHVTIPSGKGPVKGEIAMYLNKKAEPGKKTAILFSLVNVGDTKQGEHKGEIKFTSPGLAKDLSIGFNNKYNTENVLVDVKVILDIFSKPNSKLIYTDKSQFTKTEAGVYQFEHNLGLKSAGMGIDISYEELLFEYDSKSHTFKHSEKLVYNVDGKKKVTNIILELSPQVVHAGATLLDREIFDVNAKLQLSSDAQIVDADARAIGLRPTVSHFELKNYNMMKYTIAAKDNPGKQLVVSAAFIPGQIADCRAQVGQNELFKVSMNLDSANFLKPDYGISVDNIKSMFLQPCQQGISDFLKEGKVLGGEFGKDITESSKHLGEVVKKNVPDLKHVRDYYSAELNKVKEEIGADKTIQQVGEFFKGTLGAVIKAVAEITSKALELINSMLHVLQANLNKVIEVFNAEIFPQLKQLAETSYNIVSAYLESISNIFFTLVGKLAALLEKHQEPLKQLANQFSEITQEFARLINKNLEIIRSMIDQNVKAIYEELKALPMIEEIKKTIDSTLKGVGGYSEPLKNMIRDTLSTLKDIIPSEEGKAFIASISDYAEKKMSGVKVDDFVMLQKIADNFLVLITQTLKQLNIKQLNFVNPNTYAANYFYAVPQLVAAKFSPLNHLFSGEAGIDTLKESLYGLSFNPVDWLPPFRLYGVIVQGQHIFTFDGKHITFPGKCNYLLSRDAVNGNFTIAGTYTNGVMTALTLADKTDMITIKKGGQCMYNKDSTDFPIRRGELEGDRLYNYIKISSKAGVSVYCDPQLVTCLVSVSGYYHGQLRGLLGNGNHEPYDDFTMPNGKIVTSEKDFGNSYKMGSACQPVQTVDHSSHHHAPSCTKLFGPDSSLSDCFPFVNTANFRMACDHGVAAGVKDTEEAIGMGYVAACQAKYIPVSMPVEYARCKNSEQPKEIGQKFSVKHPSKAADIVIVVDQVKNNENIYKELVQPLISELTKELASKGITDVEIHLMGYGGEYEDPVHYTHGGKLAWKGKLPSVKFYEPKKDKSLDVRDAKVNKAITDVQTFIRDLMLVTGQDLQARAYSEALNYPFRSHASRTLIAVTGGSCPQGNFLLLQKLRSLVLIDKSINLNMITPLADLKVKDAKVTKNVIGFNGENVFTLTDAKKKPEGGSELHKDLEYNDYCVDFTIKNNGNVFSATNFGTCKAAQKKQFTSVVSHNVVSQIVSNEKGLDCECVFADEMTPINKCTVVHTAAKSTKKAHKKK